MDKKLLQDLKEKLEKEKESLEKELASFAKGPARNASGIAGAGGDIKPKGDWDTRYPNFNGGNLEEEADEVQEYARLLPVEHSLELKLRDVNSALEKIKKNKYGKCEKCQKEISIERLKVCPEATFCAKCK